MRIAVKGELFRAVYFSTTTIFPDLELRVYYEDTTGVALDVLEPEGSTLLPGLFSHDYTFDRAGPHILRWTSTAENLNYYETVYVHETAERFPKQSVVSVGSEFYPECLTGTGQTVHAHIYDPDLVEDTGSAFSTIELGDGLYRSESPFVPLVEGPHLAVWFADDVFDHYQVFDVYQPYSARAVTVGFRRVGTRVPYQGLHVTFTRSDGNYSITGITKSTGIIALTLEDANYYITIHDLNNPTRVFTANNFFLDVVDPSTRSSANDVTYDIEWLDVPNTDEVLIPAQFKSLMHVQILSGPDGTPAAYQQFTVDLLSAMRLNGTVIASGRKHYVLDATGSADVPMIRNSRVRLSFPQAEISTTFLVPDESSFDFADITGTDPFTVTAPSIFYPYRTS